MIPGPILVDGSILGIPLFVDSGRAAPIVRISAAGEIIDTLAHVAMRDVHVRIVIPGATRPHNIADPWIADPLWVSDPDGRSIVIVNRPIPERAGGASFAIVRIGVNGDTLVNRRVDYVPVELTTDHADRWYGSMAHRVAQLVSVTDAQAERVIRRAVQPPRFFAPVSRMVVGRDGTMWLRREDTGRDSIAWQVFNRSGSVLGRVYLPSTLAVHRAQTDRLWAVEKDALDVPFVQVYEIAQANR